MNARDFFQSKQGLLVLAAVVLVPLAAVGAVTLLSDRQPVTASTTADRELGGTEGALALTEPGAAQAQGEATAPAVSVDRTTGPEGSALVATAPASAGSGRSTGNRQQGAPPVSGNQREPGSARATAPAASAADSVTRSPVVRELTFPAGTALRVRLGNSLTTATARVEEAVNGTLENSLVEDGVTVVPAGSAISGQVVESVRSGKVKGRARLSLRFTSLRPGGDDDAYRIQTRTWTKVAEGQGKKDAAIIGVPAAGGAIIGGIIGGKKGAAIGGATGGGAGTAVVLTQRGPDVRLGAGSVVTVRLAAPLTVRVR